MKNLLLFLVVLLFTYGVNASGTLGERPTVKTGKISSGHIMDGRLAELDWESASVIENLRTIEPVSGGQPSARTEVRILADKKNLIIGVKCFDYQSSQIISFSKLRDEDLKNEDHIRIVIDPSLDGQSGYVFMVNANGARYDAIVSNRGERENKDWDAIWEAASIITPDGWQTEIKIPVQSLNFKKGLKEWGFNVERRIQRKQETIRWANAQRGQWFTQTSRSGLIQDLPDFSYGVGISVRPSIIVDASKDGENIENDISFSPSLDISQRIGSNVIATVTANTDFAETEVDTRRTNLTRFPLFFPEKRAFFLEGSDIFEFGLGLRRDMIPFFSRRIGLYEGESIPINIGGKVNGRIGNTAFGALSVRTGSFENDDFNIDGTNMSVVRVRQNIMGESSVGYIGTFGNPSGASGSWMSGMDFTYQTSTFNGNKNFLVGIWGLYAQNEGLFGNRSAFGFKIDYPNDYWDIGITYMRIGEDFDPSIGFVPRTNTNLLRIGGSYNPRPEISWLRQMRNQFFFTYYSNLQNEWESYRLFTAPINWRFESGDRIEINISPRGERLIEEFEISDGVVIPVGDYHFMRYRIEAEFAAKRKVNGMISWWFGPFYDGTLHEISADLNWNPLKIVTFEFTANRNIARLAFGDFNQTVFGTRVRFNITTDLQINSYIQYDTESDEIGTNTRLHWIFHPQGDFFIVYNYNTFNILDRWQLDTRQLLVKFRYNFRL